MAQHDDKTNTWKNSKNDAQTGSPESVQTGNNKARKIDHVHTHCTILFN